MKKNRKKRRFSEREQKPTVTVQKTKEGKWLTEWIDGNPISCERVADYTNPPLLSEQASINLFTKIRVIKR